MNKDKAIQLLERLQDPEPYEPMLTKDAYDAIQMAIDALSADGDTISRAKAIEAIDEIESEIAEGFGFDYEKWRKYFCDLPPAQPEKLTDIEQRIFIAAMSKEEKVCREVDKELSDADCINLMRVCKSIERKVKGALWT